jgi:hypothetical protein
MIPKKFLYEETAYMGRGTYIVKLENEGLKIQSETSYIPRPDVVVKPTTREWEDFFNSVVNLNLKPEEPKHLICDGREVKCHITFKKKLIKFYIINPDFENFEEFRTLINSLTICDDYPNGLLEQED